MKKLYQWRSQSSILGVKNSPYSYHQAFVGDWEATDSTSVHAMINMAKGLPGLDGAFVDCGFGYMLSRCSSFCTYGIRSFWHMMYYT